MFYTSHAALPHIFTRLSLREFIFFNDSSGSGALHMAVSQRTLSCFPPTTSMQNSQELFRDLVIKMMGNICSHCCVQRQHHNCTDFLFFSLFLLPLFRPHAFCVYLSLLFILFRQTTPGTANKEESAPSQTGWWDVRALNCSSTSLPAMMPCIQEPVKPRAPGQAVTRTGVGLVPPSVRRLPLHLLHPLPLSPLCPPVPHLPPQRRSPPLPPCQRSSSSSSWQCRPREVRARQLGHIVWLVRGQGSGGGVYMGSSPPLLCHPVEVAVATPAPVKRGGHRRVLTQAAWLPPASLGICTLTLSRLERWVAQAAVAVVLRRAAGLGPAMLTGTSQ